MTRFMTSSDRAPSSSASSEPLVSLHMAMLNTRPYVEQAVRSICRQSYQNWELLVWDDGSTDGSREIVADMARSEPRIRLLGGEHLGVGSALVRELVREAGRSGAAAVLLEVRESNAGARRLYEKIGFSEIGRRPDYYRNPPEDALLLKISISIP